MPVNKPLIDQLRGLYFAVNVLGEPDSAITDDYHLGYNAALDRVLAILRNAGFEEGKSTAASEIEFLNSELAKGNAVPDLRNALSALLRRDERNTCRHEETHRGGAIWEICDACGAKWADDQGGKPEWKEPAEWELAYAALTKSNGDRRENEDASAFDVLLTPRHIDEWHEDIGPVLWWTFPITEAPYIGSPLDCGHTVEMRHYAGGEGEVKTVSTSVGGWPGYHKWWTPLLTNGHVGLIQKRIEDAISKRRD